MNKDEKEDYVDQIFCEHANKDDPGPFWVVVELWHFMGCVKCNGIDEFVDYPNLDSTVKALRLLQVNILADKLICIANESLHSGHINGRKLTPMLYEDFEYQFEKDESILVDKLFDYCLKLTQVK